ncbi:MAG: peptidyl-prolyl cis-trans isomerase [Planctomycetota bacterium]|jgi:parvulin-like peptidyl-prolyl isomerase
MCYRIIVRISLCVILLSIVSCSDSETSTPKLNMEPEAEAVNVREVEAAEVVETETVKADEPQSAEVEPVPIPEADINDVNDEDLEVVIAFGDYKLTMREIKLIHPQAEDSQIVRLANSWLETHLLYAEAERRGITRDPKMQFIADMMKKGEFIKGLRTQVENTIVVSDDDIQAYYDEKKDTDRGLTKMGYLSFTHVRTKTLEEATDVLEKVKSGKDIKTLARRLSIAKDAPRGGAVNRAAYSRVQLQFGEELLDALAAAKEGDLAGPVKTKEGEYEVAQLTSKTEPTPLPFEQVKGRIKTKLEQQRTRSALIDLRNSLKKGAENRIVKSDRLMAIEKAMAENKTEPEPSEAESPDAR